MCFKRLNFQKVIDRHDFTTFLSVTWLHIIWQNNTEVRNNRYFSEEKGKSTLHIQTKQE